MYSCWLRWFWRRSRNVSTIGNSRMRTWISSLILPGCITIETRVSRILLQRCLGVHHNLENTPRTSLAHLQLHRKSYTLINETNWEETNSIMSRGASATQIARIGTCELRLWYETSKLAFCFKVTHQACLFGLNTHEIVCTHKLNSLLVVLIRFQESPKPERVMYVLAEQSTQIQRWWPVFYFTSSSVLSYPLTQWHVHSLEIDASHWTRCCICEFITGNVASTGRASVIVYNLLKDG